MHCLNCNQDLLVPLPLNCPNCGVNLSALIQNQPGTQMQPPQLGQPTLTPRPQNQRQNQTWMIVVFCIAGGVGIVSLGLATLLFAVYRSSEQSTDPADVLEPPQGSSLTYDADTYFNRGYASLEAGDAKGAIDNYSKAIQLNPNLSSAYNNRALAYVRLGNLKSAITDFNKAIELDPGYALAYMNRGNARHNLGEVQGALKDLNKAIQLDSKNPDAYYYRGVARSALEDYELAVKDLNQAIQLRSDFINAYFERGAARYFLSDLQGTIEDQTIVIQSTPDYPQSYHYRGNARFDLGDEKGAGQDYREALRLYENKGDRENAKIVRSLLNKLKR
jgi:tetratricopeptide (TPR) repeat protein